VNPPGPRLTHFFPRLDERWSIYQHMIEELVKSFGDPDVRLVPASLVPEELGEALLDGLHLSPAAHQRLAERLTDEIEPWLRANTV